MPRSKRSPRTPAYGAQLLSQPQPVTSPYEPLLIGNMTLETFWQKAHIQQLYREEEERKRRLAAGRR